MSYVPRYVSVGGACGYLQIDGSDQKIVDDVLFLLEYAEFLADSYLGTSYSASPAHTAKAFNGLGTNMITLAPVLSVLDKVELLSSDGIVVSTYDDSVPMPPIPKYGGYRWIARRNGQNYQRGLANIRITGTWGVTPVPVGLGFATCLILQHLFNMRKLNAFVRGEVNSERQVYQVTPAEQDFLPPTARQILDKFRVHAIELSE